MKYRMLKQHEKPDKKHGDQFRMTLDDKWHDSIQSGVSDIAKINKGFSGNDIMKYRRPIPMRNQ